jgi:hypothetical protein
MVRSKYANREAIEQKIRDLFADRKLTDLMQAGQLEKDAAFMNSLVNIQLHIYKLDEYLESTWELDDESLAGLWNEIDKALAASVTDPALRMDMVREIRRYEKIEKDCRLGKWPTRIGFNNFYRTKSCDVRLIRHLIYRASSSMEVSWKEKDWAIYDMITEVYDDLHDLGEDIHTYNGNRFLISILRKGQHRTGQNYRNFILQLDKGAVQLLQKHVQQESYRTLHHWTRERIEETRKTLTQRIESIQMDQLSESYLLNYMK